MKLFDILPVLFVRYSQGGFEMETNVEKNSGTATEKPSLFGVITSPSVQFERIRERPAVWGPLLIVAAIIIVGAVLQSLGTDYSELLTPPRGGRGTSFSRSFSNR